MPKSLWSERRTPEILFWEKVDKSAGGTRCWPWLAAKRGNRVSQLTPDARYGCFRFRGKAELAHRVAYTLTFGEIPAGVGILHKCDNPSCVNPSHLILGTQKDNSRDCWSKGRGYIPKTDHPRACGEDSGNAKLTEEKVRWIRYYREKQGYTFAKLAKMYRVTYQNIRSICTRRTWRHVL
jgi:hypothetical protein